MAEHDDEQDPSPKDLRAKLEEALGRASKAEERLHLFEVKETLATKGFDLVKPEDLKGVGLDEVEAKATAIQRERQDLQAELLRKALEKTGVSAERLDEVVQELTGRQEAANETAHAVDRARSMGSVQSQQAVITLPETLHGLDAIRAGLKA